VSRLAEHLIPAHRGAIPWRRLASLMRPARRSLAGMVVLTALGSLLGLIPPLALGALVDDLARGHHGGGAGLAAVLIVLALVLEALAFTVSDGFFARAVGTLYRDLRVLMFAGAQRRAPATAPEIAGIAARFVSDAEALQDVVVSPLDVTVMGLFELLSALLTLGLLYPLAVPLALGLILLTALVTRVTQAPLARAAEERQEALEAMSSRLASELSARLDRAAAGRFRDAATVVARREIRVGWLQAANRYGSAAAANLGPIAVVAAAALLASFSAGRLLALFLLAERAFAGADSLVDLGLDIELVRGAIRRCFELVDAPDGGLQAGLQGGSPAVEGRVRAEGFEPPRA
jgi:ABC-type multidrug transport system fused ATPase/permease subunit